MMLKKSIAKRQGFYETGKDCDILIFGSSLVINGIFPMELWKEYGLSAYNFGGHGEYIAVNYWNIANALEYSNPKLVIVDVSKCFIDDKCPMDNLPYVHTSIDSMPMSRVKIKAICDLVPGKEMEFIVPFLLYHSRWEEIIHQQGYPVYNYSYGSEKREGINPMEEPDFTNEIFDGKETISMIYLRKIAELCSSRDIDLLFINMPFADNDQLITNYVEKIADEYGIMYYNILKEKYDLDYSTDFFDNEHMNPSGAIKTTRLLGEYLRDNYDLSDKSDDAIMKRIYEEYMNIDNR